MINSKEDLALFLLEDKKVNLGAYTWRNYIVNRIIHSDDYRAWLFCKAFRRYEYAINCLPNNIFCRAYKLFRRYKFNKIGEKCNLHVIPNTVGYGFKIQHIKGGGCVISPHHVGNYFSIRQFTTVGKANGDGCPCIGNNVTLGANVTIIGDISIGDNCIIGAGAVVVKDVPENSIVVGNPGKIIGKRVPHKAY